jgi:hypothetical protein
VLALSAALLLSSKAILRACSIQAQVAVSTFEHDVLKQAAGTASANLQAL